MYVEEIMYITIGEVSKLKADVKELFSAEIHFHDACGGMFFSLDEKNPALQEYLTDYFSGKNLKVNFSDDGLQISAMR
jgi:hypothetical protein